MNRFVKFIDSQGQDCFINVDHIRAITLSATARRGGSKIVFDAGSSMEVQESPERVVCRCVNAGALSKPEMAY